MLAYNKIYLGTTQLPLARWQRPQDWLPLPAAEPNSVKILKAVSDQFENFTALRMLTTAAGQYQVDWGDGVVETFNSNAIASHNYDFNDSALNGTLTSRGYKQAIISVTPISDTFSLCNLNVRAPSPAGLQPYETGFLDLNINLPNLDPGLTLSVGGITNVRHNLLERANIASWGAVTSLGDLFFGCSRLQEVNTSEWNMSNVTIVSSIFRSCTSLKQLDCSTWDISAIATWNNAFLVCSGLVSFKAPSGVLPVGTILQNAFNTCSSLTELDLSGWDVSNVVNMSSLFNMCSSLQSLNITGWNTASVTNAVSMFGNCFSLLEIPPLDLSGATQLVAFCGSAHSLTKMPATGINATVSFLNCMLGATALNEIYTNLSNTGAGKTISVSGNYGTASDDPTIATAKGWTVAG